MPELYGCSAGWFRTRITQLLMWAAAAFRLYSAPKHRRFSAFAEVEMRSQCTSGSDIEEVMNGSSTAGGKDVQWIAEYSY